MIYRLVLRNLRLYFRDRASVFFSLLGVFVMIGLYALFLGNMWVEGYGSALERIGLGEYSATMRFLIDSWIIAGVTAAASITTTMGAFGTMVDDQARHIDKDFKVSPIKRWQLVLGYILSSVIIGWMMSVFTLILGEGYILVYGGQLLSLLGWLKVLGIITLSVFASSALIFLLIAFIKSPNAFGTASTLMGTLIGVLPGIGPAAGTAMLIPVTIGMNPTGAIIMLASIYYGAMYGGSTTSILLNIPGEAASVVTCIDGYQMAKKGRAGAALGMA
ncbi:MAG TPA: tripartite tricarboxylate transporter permease, partial [Bacillota bacterium]|nr:tripartite tricarboxylate transporter permease [Bacillota bacterium]